MIRAALYLRVSTGEQSVENQRRELLETASRRGWEVVQEFADEGISGAKGRDRRPAFDRLLKAVTRRKIDMVAAGEYDASDNPLKNAPHTAEMLIVGEWKHPYPPADGGYPGGAHAPSGRTEYAGHAGHRAKYWPPVRRIDSAYGDRNLVCACPAPAAFEG